MASRIQGVQRRRWPESIYRRAQELMRDGDRLRRPGEIADLLVKEESEGAGEETPSARTIADWLKKGILRDVGSGWHIPGATPDEVGIVLPVLVELLEKSPFSGISAEEAAMLVRINSYASGLPVTTRYLVARALAQAEREGKSTQRIEHFLAYTPWIDGGRRYLDAFKAGRISTFQRYAGDGITVEIDTKKRDFLVERAGRKGKAR